MNKIYMVKRNALGQSVVASELAKSKGKLSSVAKVVGLAILGLSSSAFAETTNEITTYGQDAIAQTGGTAIGVQAQADTNSTAIGQQATASTQATANGYVSAALANETIAIGVNSGAVGGSISKDDAKTLKEIDNKITEYSKETPPVDPLNAISPTEPVIKIETIAVPIMLTYSTVETLIRDIDGRTEYQLLEIKNKLNLRYSKLANNENAYNALNEKIDEFSQFINDSLSLNSITEMKAVTETSVKDIYTEIKNKKDALVDSAATSLFNINPNESRLAEIKTENSRVVDLAKTVFDKQDLHNSISYDEQIFIINNAELFIEAFNLISDIDAYKELASFILPYNDLMNKMNESQYYSTVTSTIASYETALAEYNAKVAAYDQAVKNREMTEAERVVKLEEAIKELNTKTTELGLGNGYANFSQVLGSLKGRAIAIGNQAYVSGDEAVGVGYGNTVLGSRSNVVGTHNNVTTANNNVMGNDNNVTVSDGNVIVGNNITFAQGVTTSGNIALGTNTVISAPVPTASVEIQGVTHNFAGTTPTSVLSIANEGNERQIQNVAAGRVTNTSTDAINGSQLYAVVEALNAIQTINITGGDNVQATVSADKGITITETNNANGTKNYAVSTKLGKGLKVDENGAIAATAQPINGGAGVTITTNAQDEAVVNVAGVTTTTDDGKTYTRSDLTKSVGVKGDGKNIRTSTAANGDVQVKLADDIQVNSVAIHNGPTINQQGVNANNTRITNVQDGVAPTDAVNVRQLNQQRNILNQRIDNLADNVKKNKKRNDAGIASTAAMANIPQVMLAGKSGVGVGVGHRSGQNAIAVGYSRASDNAKHIIKLSAGLDTQSKATFGAGYMYQW